MNKILIFLIFLVIVVVAILLITKLGGDLKSVFGGITDEEIQEQLAKLEIKGFKIDPIKYPTQENYQYSEEFEEFKNNDKNINSLLTYLHFGFIDRRPYIIMDYIKNYDKKIKVMQDIELVDSYFDVKQNLLDEYKKTKPNWAEISENKEKIDIIRKYDEEIAALKDETKNILSDLSKHLPGSEYRKNTSEKIVVNQFLLKNKLNMKYIIENIPKEEIKSYFSNENKILIETDEIILQPLSIAITRSEGHATGLLINNKTKEIIYIDPNFEADRVSYKYAKAFSDRLIMLKFSDYEFISLSDIYKDIECLRPFQGSFIEKKGMCLLWSIYLMILFSINGKEKYKNIIKIHNANPGWTKRKIENFAFDIYQKHLKGSNITPRYNETFKTPVSRLAKSEDCVGTSRPFYSQKTKKCYETEEALRIDEDEYMRAYCTKYGDEYNPESKRCEHKKSYETKEVLQVAEDENMKDYCSKHGDEYNPETKSCEPSQSLGCLIL